MNERLPAIGTLTDRVQLRRRTGSLEDGGGIETVYLPIVSVWARVRSLPMRAGVWDDQRAYQTSHSVVLRYRTDVSAGDRIVYRGRTLEIQALTDLNGRRAYLSCACLETGMAA